MQIYRNTDAIAAAHEMSREAAYDALFGMLRMAERVHTSRVTEGEIASWADKYAAAIAYVAESATAKQIEMLAVEASFTGEAVADLAATIITKGDLNIVFVAAIAGLRRKYEAIIAQANDFPTVLAAAAAEMAALAAD